MKINSHSPRRGVAGKGMLAVMLILIMTILSGCDDKKAKKDAEGREDVEEYHADNDIAMVVRSIADAIRVGEHLDSIDYDYSGVLTDGQGTPLYTDVHGAPGQWTIDVIDDHKAVIRNLYLGDLLPQDLEAYVTQCLHLTPGDHIAPEEDYEPAEDGYSDLALYHIPGGELRFETREGIAPNGKEGPLLSIVLQKKG